MVRKDPDIHITRGIEKYMEHIQAVFADSLVMAALYGSAATGHYIAGVSDINMLFVVDPPSPKRLFELAERTKRVAGKYRITPHILSKQELFSSADVFPVEYLEIGETMELIHGTNLIEELKIDRKNLRHQVESMIRGEINSLRQLVLTQGGRRKLFFQDLRLWAGRQAALMRSLLRLVKHEHKQDLNPKHIIEEIVEAFEVAPRPLLEVEDLREGVHVSRDIVDVISDLLMDYIHIAEILDGPTYR